jgi:hypothetical protein
MTRETVVPCETTSRGSLFKAAILAAGRTGGSRIGPLRKIGRQMRRRECTTVLSGAAALETRPTTDTADRASEWTIPRGARGLRDQDLAEGRNDSIERRSAEGVMNASSHCSPIWSAVPSRYWWSHGGQGGHCGQAPPRYRSYSPPAAIRSPTLLAHANEVIK